MQWVPGVLVLVVILNIGGGVTKKTANPNDGISQFWTDDYKVFDQIYGKTSDRDIYGGTLPPSLSYGLDLSQLKTSQDTQKKEQYFDNDGQNSNLANTEIDPYGFGQRYTYNSLLAKEAIKALNKNINPTKSPLKFLATDYKPISHTSDPDTYNYLKHLEKLQKAKLELPETTLGGFKPYGSFGGLNFGTNFGTGLTSLTSDHESNDAYRSIQDIIEAHEANKGSSESSEEEEEEDEYVTPKTKKPAKNNRNKKQKPRKPAPVNNSKPRCPSGRCRKRSPSSYRAYRPYIRRIKKVYY